MSTEAPSKSLSGKGLMQSVGEWSARNDALSAALSELVRTHGPAVRRPRTRRRLPERRADRRLGAAHRPALDGHRSGHRRAAAVRGRTRPASRLGTRAAVPGCAFRLRIFANVYEHVAPELREPSLREMLRVLKPGGVLVGQLPNPYFPIESHSRLPFMGCLPRRLQLVYWKLSPVPWEHNFYSVTIRDLRRRAVASATSRSSSATSTTRPRSSRSGCAGLRGCSSPDARRAVGVAVRAAAPRLTDRGSGSSRRSPWRAASAAGTRGAMSGRLAGREPDDARGRRGRRGERRGRRILNAGIHEQSDCDHQQDADDGRVHDQRPYHASPGRSKVFTGQPPPRPR